MYLRVVGYFSSGYLQILTYQDIEFKGEISKEDVSHMWGVLIIPFLGAPFTFIPLFHLSFKSETLFSLWKLPWLHISTISSVYSIILLIPVTYIFKCILNYDIVLFSEYLLIMYYSIFGRWLTWLKSNGKFHLPCGVVSAQISIQDFLALL